MNQTKTTTKTKTKSKQLTALELEIIHKYQSLFQIAELMNKIWDQQLYQSTHPTFEAYCLERWGLKPEHSNEIINSQSVIKDLLPLKLRIRAFPTNPEQIQQYYGLTREQRIELALIVERELGRDRLTAEFILACKLKLFLD
jgi:hypothetical protein